MVEQHIDNTEETHAIGKKSQTMSRNHLKSLLPNLPSASFRFPCTSANNFKHLAPLHPVKTRPTLPRTYQQINPGGLMNRKGPTKLTYDSCLGCDHHYSEMVCSGRNPIYDHYCKEARECIWPSWKPRPPGKRIGTTDQTPDWCPELGMNKKAHRDEISQALKNIAKKAER